MAKVEHTSDARVLVGIDISKHRHEVLIAVPGKTRRRRMTITNSTVRTVERGSVGPVFMSSTVARCRHFATVFGLMLSSRLNCASEACDRCIAALMACVVVALP